MKKVRAGGVLIFRENSQAISGWEFLLMKHPKRWDLPKGHAEESETFQECALREMEEETGIRADQILLDPDFRSELVYFPKYKRFSGKRAEKTLVIFLGFLQEEVTLKLTEHGGFSWVTWEPPHKIQKKTIDPLLEETALFFDERGRIPLAEESA